MLRSHRRGGAQAKPLVRCHIRFLLRFRCRAAWAVLSFGCVKLVVDGALKTGVVNEGQVTAFSSFAVLLNMVLLRDGSDAVGGAPM